MNTSIIAQSEREHRTVVNIYKYHKIDWMLQKILVDNNRSVNEIMENESLFHDTTRSGVEWNKLEFSIISLTERLLCILYVELCCCRA